MLLRFHYIYRCCFATSIPNLLLSRKTCFSSSKNHETPQNPQTARWTRHLMPVTVSVVVKRTASRVIRRKPVLFSWISKARSAFSLLKSFAFLISPNWRPKLSVKAFFTASSVRVCAVAPVHSFSLGKNSDFKKWHHSWHRTFLPWEREDSISAANNKWKSGEDKSSGDQNTQVWQIKKKKRKKKYTHMLESFIQDTRCAQEERYKMVVA